uniref:Dynein regulatory complex subunit 7 n=1 Tax=Photinus pyralis TaxID=7054 RepID=A0A1Y1MSI4_PHOPY
MAGGEGPPHIYSPHTVFLRQQGHSFEIATCLCSLLIGQGYDAYVVSGYATQDVSLKIMTRVDSPFPPEVQEALIVSDQVAESKYALKPPKDLRSKFLLAMEQREIDKVNAQKAKEAEAEAKRLEALEKPPFDELHAQRLHSWVLLLAGSKRVENSVFIEPTTGTAYPLDCKFYFGIESVWNNVNYWVNLQDCSKGLEYISYDFSNLSNWEHLLIGEPFKWRESHFPKEMEDEEVDYLTVTDEKHLDMPTPWSLRISLSHGTLAKRFPDGVKKTWYKRTYVEQFAPYIQEDGLIVRICRYRDLDYSPSELYVIEEHYENRADNLVKIVSDSMTGDIFEYYSSGREDCMKMHHYASGDEATVEQPRDIEFYHHARYDGLSKLIMHSLYMTEYYENTEDRIYYRHIDFAPRGKPPPGILEGTRRIVVKVCEKFHRNENKPASEDVAIREFAITDREIRIKYHYEEGKVTASTRDFFKSLADMGDELKFSPELTVGYQAEIGAKPPRQLKLFYLFEQQLKEEEKVLYHIREIEDQITEVLKLRCMENAFTKLKVSLFNREYNQEHRRGMLEREQQEKEYREREVEDEVDYLTPYLARLGKLKRRLSRSEAIQARDWCLREFKVLLLDRAIDIQNQFETVSQTFQNKQQWHTAVRDTLSIEEEAAYFEEMNELTFLLRTLEIRLMRHKDLSPYRYEILENYLNIHPVLESLQN